MVLRIFKVSDERGSGVTTEECTISPFRGRPALATLLSVCRTEALAQDSILLHLFFENAFWEGTYSNSRFLILWQWQGQWAGIA